MRTTIPSKYQLITQYVCDSLVSSEFQLNSKRQYPNGTIPIGHQLKNFCTKLKNHMLLTHTRALNEFLSYFSDVGHGVFEETGDDLIYTLHLIASIYVNCLNPPQPGETSHSKDDYFDALMEMNTNPLVFMDLEENMHYQMISVVGTIFNAFDAHKDETELKIMEKVVEALEDSSHFSGMAMDQVFATTFRASYEAFKIYETYKMYEPKIPPNSEVEPSGSGEDEIITID